MEMINLNGVIDKNSYDYQDKLFQYLYENKVRLVDFYGSRDTDPNNKYLQLDEFVQAYSVNIHSRWTKDRASFYRRFKNVKKPYTVAKYKLDDYRGYWLVEKRKVTRSGH